MRHVLRHRLRATVLVTLKTGATVRGALYDHDNQTVVLRNAEALADGAPPTPIDGELIVLLADVMFLQIAG